MRNRSSRKTDNLDEVVAAVMQVLATRGTLKTTDGKNPLAVALGRMGGLKGGKARAAKLTAKERSDGAKKAAQARWQAK